MTDDELKFFISGSVNAAFVSLLRALSLTHTSKYTLFSWLDFWYIEFKEKHIPPFSESGLYQIRNCIDKHIKGNFDNKPLHELTALDCMTAINKISSSRMAVYAYDTLNDSLTRAVVFGELRENPLLKVDKPKHKREKKLPLTIEQEVLFLSYIRGHRLENLFRFYLSSGVRKSEALSLRWTDIDFDKKRIFINGTKTESSRRYLPLFDCLLPILITQPHTSDFVFPYADYTLKNTWRWLCYKYSDITYTIHSLRHTFATRCYEKGISDKVIQKWLGHSRVSTTQDIYIDVLDDYESNAIRLMNIQKNRP